MAKASTSFGGPRGNKPGRPPGATNLRSRPFRELMHKKIMDGDYVQRLFDWIDKAAEQKKYVEAADLLINAMKLVYPIPQDEIEYTAGHFTRTVELLEQYTANDPQNFPEEFIAKMKEAASACAIQNFADEE